MKIVINADDFGLSKGVTDGIIKGHKDGIITSTTTMCNLDYLEYARDVAKDFLDLGIGVHLNLTSGKSLTKNVTLTDDKGIFLSQKTIFTKDLDAEEVYSEWKAQIERFIEVFGKLPSHLDSHHMVHNFNNKQLEIAKRLAKEYQLELRSGGRFKFIGDFYGDNLSVEKLIKIIEDNKGEDIEIMCHAGFVDLELYRNSVYHCNRIVELDILCDKKIKQYIVDEKIQLSNYNSI